MLKVVLDIYIFVLDLALSIKRTWRLKINLNYLSRDYLNYAQLIPS
jgi:hypothetical protein